MSDASWKSEVYELLFAVGWGWLGHAVTWLVGMGSQLDSSRLCKTKDEH
jgi:hypothetical protein